MSKKYQQKYKQKHFLQRQETPSFAVSTAINIQNY
jgi:hypothetical protein